MLVWAVLRNNTGTQRFLWKVLIVAAIAMTLAAMLSLAGVPLILSVLKFKIIARERPDLAFKAYAAAAMCLVPIVAWAGVRLSGQWRWWGYAFAPLALSLMVLAHNRAAIAGFLAMAVMAVTLLALGRHKHTKILSASALAVVIGAIAWVRTKELGEPSLKGLFAPE
ncbi:MAG: hypothetical protein JKY27_09785 [Magnetovibrio sp.]|nr:hypothetical protein [Magnetovibrio sp.]